MLTNRPHPQSARLVARALLFVAACAPVRALGGPAEVRFEPLRHATGPSHNSIFAVLEDHRGFLWLGTQDGLDRWDGNRFESYRHDPEDPDAIAADEVRDLLEDSLHRLWVATAAGLDRFDRSRGVFVHTERAGSLARSQWRPLRLLEQPAGTLWAGGTDGLFRWDEDAEVWRRRFVEIGAVAALRAGPGGALWVLEAFEPGASQRLWWISADGELRSHRLGGASPQGVLSFAIDPRGRLWFDASGPVEVAGPGSDIDLPWGSRPPEAYPLSFLLAGDGTLWMGTTYQGVVRRRLDRRSWDPVEDPVVAPVSERRLGNWAEALAVDDTGILWVGTEDGLYRHDPNLKPFHHWGEEDGGGLPAVPVSSLAETPDGGWWVGTFGNGLYRLSRAGEVEEHHGRLEGGADALPRAMVWSLAVHAEELFVGLADGRLCRGAVVSPAFRCRQLPVRRIGQIVPAHGRLWLAALGGLVLVDPASGESEVFERRSPVLAQRDLVTVVPLSGAEAFVGTWAGELLHFDRRQRALRVVARLAAVSSPVLDLLPGRDGGLWVGHGEGLARLDPATGGLEMLRLEPAPPGSNLYSVLEDPAGRLWLGTNRGLLRYDPAAAAGERVRPYGRADGLRNREYNRHARARSRDAGWLLFGGERGVTVFDPAAIRDNPHPPPVEIVAAEVSGHDGTRPVTPWGLESLELSSREDAFQLEATALSFTSPEQNRYRHKLEGYDERWVESGTVREIRYSHLPPGRYVLRVQAANNDGVWNRAGLALPVAVAPPFWQTWWFRLLLVALLLLGLYGFHRLRVRRAVEVERLRLRIASDLHDQLSSDLSGIALITDLVRRRAGLDERDRSRLGRARDQALQSVRALREIVWYVDPHGDGLAQMGDRMREAANDLLPDHDVRCETRLPAGLRAPMLWRRELFLAYKEMLHNVARHADAERVQVELVPEPDRALTLRVADDGVGFEPDSTGDGLGLRSLERRARALGGRVEVRSALGGGTVVELTAPLPGSGT